MQIEPSAVPAVLDWFVHGGELIAFAGVAWKVIARLNRDETLKQDYPPHRHVGTNGSSVIVYPDEYQPAKVERINGQS